MSTKYIFVCCLNSIAYFVFKVYFVNCLNCVEYAKSESDFFLSADLWYWSKLFCMGKPGLNPATSSGTLTCGLLPTGITIDKCYTICITSCREHKLKYRCTADFKFILFGFSCLVFVVWTTVLLVWSKPKQSNRRSAVLWYFILWWVFSASCLWFYNEIDCFWGLHDRVHQEGLIFPASNA